MRQNTLGFGLLAFFVAAVACGGGGGEGGASSGGPGDDAGASSSSSSSSSSGSSGSADGGAGECEVGRSVCTGARSARRCEAGPGGARWVDVACPAGQGCALGKCEAARCSDECIPGEAQAGKTCKLVDVKTGAEVAPQAATSLHDRARAYVGFMPRGPLAAGGIASVRYSDPGVFTKIEVLDGIGDSAIWTGTYLAAEALRLQATGAADARARVRALASTMHLWMNVAGEPGMLVRYAKESSVTYPFVLGDLDCANERVHCGISYAGKKYDFVGHISRDQYQGAVLGMALAYDALGGGTPEDDAARALLREDLVVLVEELMKERSVPVSLTVNGVPVPVSPLTMRFVVVSPREMKGGKISLRVVSGKLDDSEMYGFQEFTPDLADVVKQLPGLGASPPIRRESSAIMLASFFQVALRVTDGVPAYAARRDAIRAYYTSHAGPGGNVKDWLEIAKGWQDGSGPKCGAAYYGNNITMQPMYDLARLEDDPGRKKVVVDEILGGKLWPAFERTKNPFFSFLYAGVTPTAAAAVTASARAQLAQFPPPPRVQKAVDLRADPRYAARESGCTDQVAHTDAVDVGDRIPGDFMWQRHPWGLYDPGDPRLVQPGVDYLAAYWLGRAHRFVDDEAPAVCGTWR